MNIFLHMDLDLQLCKSGWRCYLLKKIVKGLFTGIKSEETNPHSALFDKMEEVLRHFFSPHDPSFYHNFGAIRENTLYYEL